MRVYVVLSEPQVDSMGYCGLEGVFETEQQAVRFINSVDLKEASRLLYEIFEVGVGELTRPKSAGIVGLLNPPKEKA